MSYDDIAARSGDGPLPTVARRALALDRLIVKEGAVLWCADFTGDAWTPPGPDETLAALAGQQGASLPAMAGDMGLGLYDHGTRVLSYCGVTIEGQPLPPPAAAESEGYEARLAFPELGDGQGQLSVLRTFLADGDAIHLLVSVETQEVQPAPVRLTLALAADTRGMVDAQARLMPVAAGGLAATFTGRGPDGERRRLAVTCDPAPITFGQAPPLAPDQSSLVTMTFALTPTLGEPATLAVALTPARSSDQITVKPLRQEDAHAEAVASLRHRHARWHLDGAIFQSALPVVNALLRRGAADLRLLMERDSAGGELAPVAGLPARARFGGHEALLAAAQSLMLNPAIAEGTVRRLARYQADSGGILPAAPAGGRAVSEPLAGGTLAGDQADVGMGVAADSLAVTPLWLALFAETVDWTGDLALLHDLLPAGERALAYLDGLSDRPGDGYLRAAGTDARTGADVGLDLQVYTFLARRAMARLLRHRGMGDDRARAAVCDRAADALRRRIERDFWLPSEGCYAPGLDADGHSSVAVTDCSALALWAGIPGSARAARLAERLLAADLASGWGLRARAGSGNAGNASETTEDVGSADDEGGLVWPHMTALAAAGLWRAGEPRAAARLARGLFAAATAHVDGRLPSVFGGASRAGAYADAPRPRAEASAPFGPAAAAPFGIVAAMLGVEADALGHRLALRPVLPAWLRALRVQHLRVGEARVDLEVRRLDHDGICGVNWQVTAGELQVVIRPPARTWGGWA